MKILSFLFVVLCMSSVIAKEKTKLPDTVKSSVLVLLEKNDVLHDKFFTYNANDVASEVKNVLNLIAKDQKVFSSSQALDLEIQKVKNLLLKLAPSQTEDENKKNFSLANALLVNVINSYDLGEKYKAYYCPMVRKKWIQDVSKKAKVQNPYDASMPECGGRL